MLGRGVGDHSQALALCGAVRADLAMCPMAPPPLPMPVLQGLYDSIAHASSLGLPVYVTETGLADRQDDRRADLADTYWAQVGGREAGRPAGCLAGRDRVACCVTRHAKAHAEARPCCRLRLRVPFVSPTARGSGAFWDL